MGLSCGSWARGVAWSIWRRKVAYFGEGRLHVFPGTGWAKSPAISGSRFVLHKGTDISVWFPAVLQAVVNGHKFICYDCGSAQHFLMTPIKDLRGMEMRKGKHIGLRCKSQALQISNIVFPSEGKSWLNVLCSLLWFAMSLNLLLFSISSRIVSLYRCSKISFAFSFLLRDAPKWEGPGLRRDVDQGEGLHRAQWVHPE